MKKFLFSLIAIATLTTFSISESNAQVKVSGGLRIGFNASNYVGKTGITGYKFVPGVHIGGFVRVALKEKYRIQADVLFSTKGSVYTGVLGFSPEKYYQVPFYIDVPVMFNYKPIAGLYMEAGVQPSFALTVLNFSANTSSALSSLSSNNIRSTIFAPIVGAGYEFKKVSLGLRGTFGGTSVSSITTSSYKPKNLTLMATFGFKF